jgi:hypothetical protein
MRKLFFLFLLLAGASKVMQAQITWNFGTTAVSGTATVGALSVNITPTVLSATTQAQNVTTTVAFLTTPALAAPYNNVGASGTFSGNAFAKAGTFAAATSTYLQFVIAPTVATSWVNITAINWGNLSLALGGPTNFTLYSSVDNYTNQIGTATATIGTTTWSLITPTITPITGAVGTAVTIRIYGHGGTGTPSATVPNWRVDDVIISATAQTSTATVGQIPKYTGPTTFTNSIMTENNGKIGVGTATPAEKLDVAGTIKSTGLIVTTGTPAANKFLTSIDVNGTATWSSLLNVANGGTGVNSLAAGAMLYGSGTTPMTVLPSPTTGNYVLTTTGAGAAPTWSLPAASTNYWTATGNNIANNTAGNVGIGTGTTAPAFKLDVNGDGRIANKLSVGGGPSLYNLSTSGALNVMSPTGIADIQIAGLNGNSSLSFNGDFGTAVPYRARIYLPNTGADLNFTSNSLGGRNAGFTFFNEALSTTIPLLKMQNNGNVGISVASPTSLLHLPLSGTIAIGTPDVSTTEGAALSSTELRFRTNTNYNTSLAAVPGAYELQVLDKNNSTLGGIKANIAKVNSIYSTNNFVVANVLDGQLKVGGQAYGGTPFYVKENSGTTDIFPSMIIEAGKSSAAAAIVPLSLHLKPVINLDNVTTGISFGGNNIGGVDNSNSSQAGIYVRSSNVQGTTMKFATTNAYANGAQMRMTIDPIGNVGIGTETPASNAKLDIVGKIKITDATQAVGRVLTSDANGLASWADIPVTAATTTAWGLLGNTNATATSFLGTPLNTDFDLIFKRNGVLSGKLNSALALTTFGVSAGLANTTGINNTFLGTASGATNTAGEKNTGLGVQSLLSNISGNNNTALGINTLRTNTTGSRNLAIGYDALYGNTTGTDNIAIGLSAGSSITSGIKNIILGSPSATSPTNLTQGSYNTIIGSDITGISPTLSNNIILADGQGNRRINVNEFGNVGIGTITPISKLHVAGDATIKGALYLEYSNLVQYPAGQNWINFHHAKQDTKGQYFSGLDYSNASGLVALRAGGGTINLIGSSGVAIKNGLWNVDHYDYTTQLIVNPNGNVGIGTETPTNMLHVEKNANTNVGALVINPNAGGSAASTLTVGSSPTLDQAMYLYYGGTGNTVFGSLKANLIAASGTTGGMNISVLANAPLSFGTNSTTRMSILGNGNVGIGVSTVPNDYKLAVAGAIIATKVTVKLQANWPDYVFNKNYELPSLQSVESFIKINNHLPGVPSADKVKKEGIDLGDNQTILLKKVEELTLYIIDQDKKIVKLQAEKDELKNMQKQIDELKAMLLKK